MTKQCAICGVPINGFQGKKLADGNYICRKTCKKRGLNIFKYSESCLEDVIAHFEQVEKGKTLWERFFVPRLKTEDHEKKLKQFKSVYVAEDIGLMAFKEKRYKFLFWGKTEHFCVYRIADLRMYDVQSGTMTNNGKSKTTGYLYYHFGDVKGLNTFRVQYASRKECWQKAEYFDSLFGLETKQLSLYEEMKELAYIVQNTDVDPFSIKTEKEIVEVMKKMGKYKEGDRTQWIEKAEITLK